MKLKSLFIAMMPLVITTGFVMLTSASGGQLLLLKQEKIPEIKQLDPDYSQERIIEQNERFDGILLCSKSDGSIHFALLDENQSMVWRKPAPSSRVIIAQKTPRIAMIGKSYGEGYVSVDREISQGVDVLDFSGNLIFRLDDTGIIRQVFLSPYGELLLSTKDLRLYDPDGKLSWKSAPSPRDARFVGDGRYIKTVTRDPDSDTLTLQLRESYNGEILREWQYTESNEMRILYVNNEENHLLMSEFVSGAPPQWNLVLYDMDQWKPIASLSHLKAGPFSPVWNSQENGFGLLLRRPRIPSVANPGEILIGFWDLNDGSLVMQSSDEYKINFHEDRMTYDAQSNQYRVRIGSNVFVYSHSHQ